MDRKEIVKYELSNDGAGLKAYFSDQEGDYYHIHSDEMTKLEKWIHDECVQTPDRADDNNFVHYIEIKINPEKADN